MPKLFLALFLIGAAFQLGVSEGTNKEVLEIHKVNSNNCNFDHRMK